MSRKFNPLVAVGALLALVGVAVLIGLASRDEKAADARMVTALVATAAVPVGTAASAVTLEVKELRSDAVPAGSPTDTSQLNGLVALRAIGKGEVVAAGAFGAQGIAATGGVRLPAGKQALGLELPFAPGGLRYVVPGNKITVWAVPKTKDNVVGVAVPVVRDVLVIATTPGAGTGAATDAAAGPGNLVFLLAVSPAEAAVLIGVQGGGNSVLYATLTDSKQLGS